MSKSRYLAIVLIFALVPSLAVLWCNGSYDPNWFFRGNIWGPRSYFFEYGRDEKVRVFEKFNPTKQYSCLLLGSSRFLTIRSDQIPYENCFNFSVSSGNYFDMVNISKYVLDRKNKISTVIIGIDDWHLEADRDDSCAQMTAKLQGDGPAIVPSSPFAFLNQYLNAKTLWFSWRVRNDYNVWIGYDRNFLPVMRPDAYLQSRGANSFEEGMRKVTQPHNVVKKKYSDFCATKIAQLVALFPQAQIIGVHTPVMSGSFVSKIVTGEFDNYTKIVWRFSQYFTHFYDPMLDINYAVRDALTWDGSHYYPEFWQYYLNLTPKIDVRQLSTNEYQSMVAESIRPFLDAARKTSPEQGA